MIPAVAITSGTGKTAIRLILNGEGITTTTAREQTAAVRPPRAAPGLAGRWRWGCTDWTAGQATITGRRKAGPLTFEIQGIVKQIRTGFSQSGWVWTVERKSDRKGTPAGTSKGRASSYGDCVRAAYVAAIALESEVCGLRTVARNTRAGRTFENAARTTGQAFKRKEQASSTPPTARSPKKVRNGKNAARQSVSSSNGTGQKKTKARKMANGQGKLF
jgi:hypothetical protein